MTIKQILGLLAVLIFCFVALIAASPSTGNGSSTTAAGNGSSGTAIGNGSYSAGAGNGNGAGPCSSSGPSIGAVNAGNANAACAPDSYFVPMGVWGSPNPIASATVWNGGPAGANYAIDDPNYTLKQCVAVQNVDSTAAIIQPSYVSVDLGSLAEAGPTVIAQDSISGNGNRLHDFGYCISLPFGAYLLPYYAADASGGAGYAVVNTTCSASCTFALNTNFPITVSTASTTNVIVGEVLNVYNATSAGTPPNTACTVANSCEKLVVSNVVANTSITFSGIFGSAATQTSVAHNVAGFLMASSNITSGDWSCANHTTASWTSNPAQAPCQPARLWSPGNGQALSAVPGTAQLLLPSGGGISEMYSARNGSQFLICGQSQTSWGLSPGQVDGCLIGYGVSPTDFYFVTTCQNGASCTQLATPAPGATPTACSNTSTVACYDPTLAGAPAFLNNTTGVVNGLLFFSRPPVSNAYMEFQIVCTTSCSTAGTATFTLNGQGTTCTTGSFSLSAGNPLVQADMNTIAQNFNTSCSSANKFGDGNTYFAPNPLQRTVAGGGSTGNTVLIECNGTCDTALLDASSTGTIHNHIAFSNTNIVQNNTNASVQGNTGLIRFVVGAVAKLRNGFYYLTESADHLNSTEIQQNTGVNGGGYYQMCIRTNGNVSISSNVPQVTWTDCAGNNSFTTSPSTTQQCRSKNQCPTVAVSRFGAGANWSGNTPTDPFCWSGATNGDSACTPGTGQVPVGTIPCPTADFANGIQCYGIISSAIEETVTASSPVNETVHAGSCSAASACSAGSVTITCSTAFLSGHACGGASGAGIIYNGEILCFDCNSPFTIAEEHVVTVNAADTTFTVTLANAHGGGSGDMTITGFHPPIQNNSAANSTQIELLRPSNGDLLIVYQANKISGTNNCGYNGAPNCDRALVAEVYHPSTQTTDTLNVLQSASGANAGYINPLCVILSPTGVLSVTAATGSASTWGGTGAFPAILQWQSTNLGTSWTGPVQLAGNGTFGNTTLGQSSNCQESQDLYTLGVPMTGNNNGNFTTEWLWEGRAP